MKKNLSHFLIISIVFSISCTSASTRKNHSEEYKESIDRDAIRNLIEEKLEKFKACVLQADQLSNNLGLTGRVITRFIIESDGSVKKAHIHSSTVNNSNLENCLLAVLKTIQFPVPTTGGIIDVKYPFRVGMQGEEQLASPELPIISESPKEKGLRRNP